MLLSSPLGGEGKKKKKSEEDAANTRGNKIKGPNWEQFRFNLRDGQKTAWVQLQKFSTANKRLWFVVISSCKFISINVFQKVFYI